MTDWIVGAVMALLSLMGLVMASSATDAVFAGAGYLFMVFGFLFVMHLIKKATEPVRYWVLVPGSVRPTKAPSAARVVTAVILYWRWPPRMPAGWP